MHMHSHVFNCYLPLFSPDRNEASVKSLHKCYRENSGIQTHVGKDSHLFRKCFACSGSKCHIYEIVCPLTEILNLLRNKSKIEPIYFASAEALRIKKLCLTLITIIHNGGLD